MISCAWGPHIGGIATPAGCGPNPLTIGFLKELAGINVDFVTWMSMGLPAAILMVPVAWFILTRMFPPEIDRVPIEQDKIRQGMKEMGAAEQKREVDNDHLWRNHFFMGDEPFIKRYPME